MIDPEISKRFSADITNEQFNAEKEFKQEVYDDLIRLAVANKFNSLEKPKQLFLVKDMWTIESDMLTPTMKTKRNIAKQRYLAEIAAMYEAGPIKF